MAHALDQCVHVQAWKGGLRPECVQKGEEQGQNGFMALEENSPVKEPKSVVEVRFVFPPEILHVLKVTHFKL